MTGDETYVGARPPGPARSFGGPIAGAQPYGGVRPGRATPLSPVTAPTTSSGPTVSPGAKTRHPVRLVVVSLIVLALAVGGVLGTVATVSRVARAARPAPSAPQVNPDSPLVTSAAATALLEARSRAVVAHDEQAFVAADDASEPAFVGRQRVLFRSLTALPLGVAHWVLRPGSAYNRPALAAAYGAPVFVTDAEFDYQLTGYDTGVVASAETLTFVRRAGHWLLGGDTDLDNLLPEGGHAEPWDLGPIEVVQGKHTLVVGAPEDHSSLPELVRTADAAVEAVAARWPDGWSHRVVVYAPRDRAVIDTYFRSDLQSVDSTAAVQIEVYDGVPEWDREGKSVGSRIIFNPTFTRPGDPDLPVLLRHEFTHAATRSVTSDATPTWLVEGFAEYVGYLGEAGDRGVSDTVAEAADKGAVVPYLPSSVDFYSDEDNYDRSWLLCLYIARTYGPAKLKALYAANAGKQLDPTDGGRLAIRSVLGISQEQLLTDVNAWGRTAVPGL